MLKKLRNQKEEEVQRKSLKIKDKLFRLKVFRQAKTVMFYITYDGEVHTQQMIKKAIDLGKKIAIPTCDTKAKKIIPCLLMGLEIGDFKRGAHYIKEPVIRRSVDPKSIDMVVVPGVAFDLEGNRLGRGLGYYDRFLSGIPEDTPKIGLAFKFQVLKHLSCCLPHDIRVDKVLFA